MRWRITIEVWPHSTGKGAAADRQAAGEREQYFYADARDVDEAFGMARCFEEGVCANPAVRGAQILGVHRRYEDGGYDRPIGHREVATQALRAAAAIARNGCLVPPDGGSPTVAEAEMCERIADAILRLDVS
jgi:hypothetical protein